MRVVFCQQREKKFRLSLKFLTALWTVCKLQRTRRCQKHLKQKRAAVINTLIDFRAKGRFWEIRHQIFKFIGTLGENCDFSPQTIAIKLSLFDVLRFSLCSHNGVPFKFDSRKVIKAFLLLAGIWVE